MTINKLLQSVGKGQSSTLRYVLAGLQEGYRSIRQYIVFKGVKKGTNTTTVFLTIPSSKKGIDYDVVIEVTATDKFTDDTEFKIYSNSPSFVYNFVYVFNRTGDLLYPEKYPTDFKSIEPKAKNPFLLYGFDKSLYCGIQTIKEMGIRNIRDSFTESIPPVSTFDQKQTEIADYERQRKSTGN